MVRRDGRDDISCPDPNLNRIISNEPKGSHEQLKTGNINQWTELIQMHLLNSIISLQLKFVD